MVPWSLTFYRLFYSGVSIISLLPNISFWKGRSLHGWNESWLSARDGFNALQSVFVSHLTDMLFCAVVKQARSKHNKDSSNERLVWFAKILLKVKARHLETFSFLPRAARLTFAKKRLTEAIKVIRLKNRLVIVPDKRICGFYHEKDVVLGMFVKTWIIKRCYSQNIYDFCVSSQV